ncbi:MAG: GTPase HflX [Alphaproteobacteria bacterium]|nr:GTPase HflX [Alphaproteobacteria bacterium]
MGKPAAIILHPEIKSRPLPRSPQEMLNEASGLAEAIGLEVALQRVITLKAPRAASYIGLGSIEFVADFIDQLETAAVVIVNTALTPVQQRNLEQALQAKVIDRTALILEIFGARAQSHAGRLQVELAHLGYQRSRLVRSWTHLERQRGGGGFLGGPGERQIELDRRMLTDRMVRLRAELAEVVRTRRLQQANRSRNAVPGIALVGYTNAGKSTLFNQLTKAGVLAKDMLFATLDPTLRGLKLPSGRQAVLADTVGFITQLPTELIAAFKSTLEEAVEADIILHIQDAASPMREAEAADVTAILDQLGLDEEARKARVIPVLNKTDLLTDGQLAELQESSPQALAVSASTAQGVNQLLAVIDQRLAGQEHIISLTFRPQDGAARAFAYENGQILESQFDEAGCEFVRVSLKPADRARLEARLANIKPS